MTKSLSLALLCLLGTVLYASSMRKLTFSPPAELKFTSTITTERIITHAGDTVADTSRVVSNHALKRARSGHTLTTISNPASKLAKQTDPVTQLFAGLSYTHYLDSGGFSYSVTGYEKLPKLIDSAFPKDTAAVLKSILQPDVLAAREMGEWNGRMANVAGRNLDFGKPIIDTSLYTMPGGARLRYYIISRIVDTLRIQGKWCLQVTITSATNPLDLAAISRLSLKAIVDLFKIPDTVLGKYPAGKGAMRSTTDLFIEMSSLLPRSEATRREIDYDIVVDTNRVYYRGKSLEKRNVNFQYN